MEVLWQCNTQAQLVKGGWRGEKNKTLDGTVPRCHCWSGLGTSEYGLPWHGKGENNCQFHDAPFVDLQALHAPSREPPACNSNADFIIFSIHDFSILCTIVLYPQTQAFQWAHFIPAVWIIQDYKSLSWAKAIQMLFFSRPHPWCYWISSAPSLTWVSNSLKFPIILENWESHALFGVLMSLCICLFTHQMLLSLNQGRVKCTPTVSLLPPTAFCHNQPRTFQHLWLIHQLHAQYKLLCPSASNN